jgi:hypothetical protein
MAAQTSELQLNGVHCSFGIRRLDAAAVVLTIEGTDIFARRFAELQGLMRIYTDAKAFDAAIVESTRTGRRTDPPAQES